MNENLYEQIKKDTGMNTRQILDLSPAENVENYEKTMKSSRGGKRPGAGRKPGKWAKAKGKSKNNLICCYVTDELKAEYIRQAEDKGLNQTQYLIWLIENNKKM